MKLKAPAKLNLFLEITGKRDDGLHELFSLFAFTEFGDGLDITPASHTSIALNGEFASAVNPHDNTLLQTLSAFNKSCQTDYSFQINLTKNIPVAAGLGGGSADAGALLRFLYKQELEQGKKISEEAILQIAASVGADAPACYFSRAALVGGIGDKFLSFLELPALYVLLVNPRQELPTARVFSELMPFTRQELVTEGMEDVIHNQSSKSTPYPLSPLLQQYANSLEEPAVRMLPEIRKILDAIQNSRDCLAARMSGSGATCFGLYNTANDAEVAYTQLSQLFPRYFIKTTVMSTIVY